MSQSIENIDLELEFEFIVKTREEAEKILEKIEANQDLLALKDGLEELGINFDVDSKESVFFEKIRKKIQTLLADFYNEFSANHIFLATVRNKQTGELLSFMDGFIIEEKYAVDLEAIETRADYSHQGLATQLHNELEFKLEPYNVSTVYIHVSEENQIGLSFLKATGYQEDLRESENSETNEKYFYLDLNKKRQAN